MYKLETNIREVSLEIVDFLNLQSGDRGMRALKIGIHDAVSLVSLRVQQQGETADGSTMHNKGNHGQIGAYGIRHGKARQKKGLQTEQVDLTYTGDLMRAFQVLDFSADEATAGFLSNSQSGKAKKMEDYYGDIFALSTSEQTDVADSIVNELMN